MRSSGVKSISLKNDYVVSAHVYNNEEMLVIITSKGTAKRVRLSEFETTSRARKGVLVVRDVKTNPYYIYRTFIVNNKSQIVYKTKDDLIDIKVTEFPITDRLSTGTQFTKQPLLDCFIPKKIEETSIEEEIISPQEEEETIEENISLNSIDERIMTIDDFLDNFEIN